MSTTSIFFNQSFDKKRLKTFLYWVLKTFGEKEALIVVEQLKSMGFYNATRAGLSIGLHDLKTPYKKKALISRAQVTIRKTDQEFQGAEVTATERSQRIVDTWHRTSEDLRKQVVDYFSTYDQLNSVYMMALSGARGNFSQVRQLIGMRGLMADPQGQIISFPIRSNLREGLTLTEYFISCSGARKGLVDTALRTADTGYLTRRLVDISHHIVVKKVTCYTSRGIALKTLRTPQKILLPLRDRLVGRVLAETIYSKENVAMGLEAGSLESTVRHQNKVAFYQLDNGQIRAKLDKTKPPTRLIEIREQAEQSDQRKKVVARKNQEISPDLALKISLAKETILHEDEKARLSRTEEDRERSYLGKNRSLTTRLRNPSMHPKSKARVIGKELTLQASRPVTDATTPQVLVRSPLTCTYTHEVCQLCYGWSMAQGSLVSLGEAVGVIAGQSIGEPGTQLTMRTFHTGGVFSGDLLQEIRAPHSGKITFPKALQGLLVRTSQGKIAFLIKVAGELVLESAHPDDKVGTSQTTRLQLAPSTILFVRQGERVKGQQILAELAITTEQGNQPIKSRQTLFSEMGGRIVQWKSMTARMHRTKGVFKELRTNSVLSETVSKIEASSRIGSNKSSLSYQLIEPILPKKKGETQKETGIQACLGPVELARDSLYYDFERSKFTNQDNAPLEKARKQNFVQTSFLQNMQQFAEQKAEHYEETRGYLTKITLKKIALAKKHGLGSIEPVQALKLGLLSVIATRVGASEKTCTKLAFSKQKVISMPVLKAAVSKNRLQNLIGLNRENKTDTLDTHMTRLQHLNTIAEEGDLVDENYTQM